MTTFGFSELPQADIPDAEAAPGPEPRADAARRARVWPSR